MSPPARRPGRASSALRHALCALVACASLAGGEAMAQMANPAAQALYDQATAEIDAGKFESACKKLEEVVRLVPDGLGAKVTLAQCYEGMGRLASAWSQYSQVEGLARKAAQLPRMKKAAAKAAALKPKLASLTIDVPAAARGVSGLTVERDGEVVGEAQWGVQVPVDKGPHTVTVRAPGHVSSSNQVEVPADGKKVSFTVPVLAPEPPPAPSTPPPVAPAPDVVPAKVRPWQAPLGISMLSVGAAGLAAGGVFGGLMLARFSASKDAGCNAENQCPPEATKIRNEARTFGDASTAAFIAGGVLATAGLVVLLTAPRGPRSDAAPARVSVELAPLPGGAVLRGAF